MTLFSFVTPFPILSASKVRPAVVVNTLHSSNDLFVIPLTSKTSSLKAGEFVLSDWSQSGLNVETALKRGVFTIHEKLIVRRIGELSSTDAARVEASLREWFGLD